MNYYKPTRHRIKVLFSVEITPAVLIGYWKRKHGSEADFKIHQATNELRADLERFGLSFLDEA